VPARRPRRLLALTLAAIVLLGAVAAALALALGSSDNPQGDASAKRAHSRETGPGTIVRSERLANPPVGAAGGWRIYYRSRGYNGKPAVVSGLLFTPEGGGSSRAIVAFTHPTVGVASRCAPSLNQSSWSKIEGLQKFLAAGDVVVAPDYQGLGSAGPHPYLVGDSEAWNTLDAVRAAGRFAPARAGRAFVAWGVSQGGQAALFTGLRAHAYAPELRLLGVAVGAPASQLSHLFAEGGDSPFARLVSAYALQSWSVVYPRLHLSSVLTSEARALVRNIAAICVDELNSPHAETLIGESLSGSYLHAGTWYAQPLAGILRANTPRPLPSTIPLLVTQGEADQVVAPSETAALVRSLCAAGDAVEYRTLPGVTHEYTGEESAGLVSAWVAQRFAGQPAPSNCG
jgi:alpha-beta hydrolase superfamily lysophospholipase